VNDGHSTGRTTGANLFAEHTVLGRHDWSVIEATGVDGDFIPATDCVETVAAAVFGGGTGVWRSFVVRTEGITMRFEWRGSKQWKGKAKE
jgi:hypothetical protein